MNIHQNARRTPRGRERLVGLMLSGQSPAAAVEGNASTAACWSR